MENREEGERERGKDRGEGKNDWRRLFEQKKRVERIQANPKNKNQCSVVFSHVATITPRPQPGSKNV